MKKRGTILLIMILLCALGAQAETLYFSSEEIEVCGTQKDQTSVVAVKADVDILSCICAYKISGVSGKCTVTFKTDRDTEQLRAVKIDGNRVSNLAGTYADGQISFSIDADGVYALIDVDEALPEGVRARDVVFAVPALCALALCAVVLFGRRQK